MILEKLAGPCHLANAFGEGLALFCGQHPADFCAALDQLGANPVEDCLPLFQRRPTPCGRSFPGGGDGRVAVFGAAQAVVTDDVIQVGGIGIDGDVVTMAPLAANIIGVYVVVRLGHWLIRSVCCGIRQLIAGTVSVSSALYKSSQ